MRHLLGIWLLIAPTGCVATRAVMHARERHSEIPVTVTHAERVPGGLRLCLLADWDGRPTLFEATVLDTDSPRPKVKWSRLRPGCDLQTLFVATPVAATYAPTAIVDDRQRDEADAMEDSAFLLDVATLPLQATYCIFELARPDDPIVRVCTGDPYAPSKP